MVAGSPSTSAVTSEWEVHVASEDTGFSTELRGYKKDEVDSVVSELRRDLIKANTEKTDQTKEIKRRGYGPAAVGSMAIPAPNAYRPRFTTADGGLDWRRELDDGFDLDRPADRGRARRLHRRTDPVVRRHPRPAARLPGGAAERCHERGMLLCSTRRRPASGAPGTMFAYERDGVVPDVLTLSKTLGAGLPLAAVLTTAEIEERAHERGFLFYTTHVSDPLPAAVGLAVLEVVARERLAERAPRPARGCARPAASCSERHECIGDVRGRGLLLGVEIVADRASRKPAPETGSAISRAVLRARPVA